MLRVTGEQHALTPWKGVESPRQMEICLDVPGEGSGPPWSRTYDDMSGFRLSLIAIAARITSRSVQYSSHTLTRWSDHRRDPR